MHEYSHCKCTRYYRTVINCEHSHEVLIYLWLGVNSSRNSWRTVNVCNDLLQTMKKVSDFVTLHSHVIVAGFRGWSSQTRHLCWMLGKFSDPPLEPVTRVISQSRHVSTRKWNNLNVHGKHVTTIINLIYICFKYHF